MSDQTNLQVKFVGFDVDGTLYPSTEEIQKRIRGRIYEKISELCRISLEKSTADFERLYGKYMSGGKAIREIFQLAKVDLGGREIVQEAMQEAKIIDLIEPNPKLVAMIKRLSIKRGLDILTGSEYNFSLEKLEKIGFCRDIFGFVLAADSGNKSNGELYKKWLQLRKPAMPRKMLYVGDNKKQDIDVPKTLGIKTCFLGEYEQADFQINSIFDLEKILESKK